MIKVLRIKKGLTQSSLAKTLGVRQSTVGMWESGSNNPKIETLLKMSKVFECTLDELLADDGHLSE